MLAEPLLDDVRVLDLSRVLAGPWATQLLADLGADVIKVERPDGGDDTRAWGPPWLETPAGPQAAYFLCANRGKRSLTVDFSTEAGRGVIRKLAETADVLVENFPVGSLARHGLDYASLSRLNPKLVYCSITGFGQTGPRAGQPGYDALIQAMGGLMSITGEADGPPQKVGVAVADIATGLYACNAILAALLAVRGGRPGRQIDVALFDSQLALLANQALNALVTGEDPRRQGSAHPSIVPYRPFRARDGWLMLAVGNDRQFRRLCEVLGLAGLEEDPRFATNAERVCNRQALELLLAEHFARSDRERWIRLLEVARVPCGPINSVREAFQDPQALARGARVSLQHPAAGQVPAVAGPLHFDGAVARSDRPPPLLGEHSEELLGELGYDPREIEHLRRNGVL